MKLLKSICGFFSGPQKPITDAEHSNLHDVLHERTASQAEQHGWWQRGTMSIFGGPDDRGVEADEGLSYVHSDDLSSAHFRDLFLARQPFHTTGLARRLNPATFYCAMRFPRTHAWKALVRDSRVRVTNSTGKSIICTPADWGPAGWTRRVIDLSPGAAASLGLHTGDIVTAELVPENATSSHSPA